MTLSWGFPHGSVQVHSIYSFAQSTSCALLEQESKTVQCEKHRISRRMKKTHIQQGVGIEEHIQLLLLVFADVKNKNASWKISVCGGFGWCAFSDGAFFFALLSIFAHIEMFMAFKCKANKLIFLFQPNQLFPKCFRFLRISLKIHITIDHT